MGVCAHALRKLEPWAALRRALPMVNLPEWLGGGLKIDWRQLRVGSSPTVGRGKGWGYVHMHCARLIHGLHLAEDCQWSICPSG